MDIEFIVKSMGAVSALSVFLFAVYQYKKAQQWKSAEFAAKQLDRLTTDPILSMACTLLDWTGRTLKVPKSYRYKAEEETFVHDWYILEKAMVPELWGEDGMGFEWQGVLYRDVFDHFFTYLDTINHYLDIKLISIDDVSSLKYWLEQINRPAIFEKKPIFKGFIRRFGYDGVNSLSRKLGVI